MSNVAIFLAMALLAAVATIFSPMTASAIPNEDEFLDLKKTVLDINDHVLSNRHLSLNLKHIFLNILELMGLWGYNNRSN